jgi:hypothetical protein
MIKNLLAAATFALVVAPLTACNSGSKSSATTGSDSAYCHDVSAAKQGLTLIAQGNISTFDSTVAQLNRLSQEAPAGVADDWKLIAGLFQRVSSAFAAAGVTGPDFAKIQKGQLPKGVDPNALLKAAKKVQDLSSGSFGAAEAKITADAKDQCNVDLGS